MMDEVSNRVIARRPLVYYEESLCVMALVFLLGNVHKVAKGAAVRGLLIYF